MTSGLCAFIYLFTWLLWGSKVCEDPAVDAGPKLWHARSTQKTGNLGWKASRWPLLGHEELWKRATLFSILCLSSFFGNKKPSSIIFHFHRALHTLSCQVERCNSTNKTVESINELNTRSLHILIICVTISLWPFSMGIYLMYSCKEMFCTEGGKNVHLFKKLPPGRRYKQRFFLSSPYYFPEHTVISSIFHAYGHECLTLPCLCVNKKEISWLKFSLEE